ncbi:uncharacterized protein EAF01_010874 [Botrytis porri]|uniref:Uncharacterized protein n=1 Tax=Botrytis porri TaxID=87229 RepID=A0A4Z1KCP5_9HELO|nr:uncharacterized protein EAF01_010874 [Botrytis porri]KAF7889381.1 hypothetical protein EAF01_010874 [Botrytis porri]TGO83118.1 hypothetical protein BPOR_0700g00070 [Botrytis porri]
MGTVKNPTVRRITETDLIEVPDLQDSMDLGTKSSEYLTRVATSTQASSSSTAGSPNGTPNNGVQGLDDINFMYSLISRSHSSFSTPKSSASPMSSDCFNFYGTLESLFSPTRSDHAHHKGSGNEPHIHPDMALIPQNYSNSSQSSLTKEQPTSILPKADGKSEGWFSPLHIAARRGHETIVRTLTSHNIDCNEKDDEMRTALIHASIDGHEPVVSLLLAHSARISDVDRRGRSALYWATMNQHQDVLRLLLWEHDKRDWEQSLDAFDYMGWTALHIAIEKGFDVGVQLLLASDADLNAKAQKTCNGDGDKDDSRTVQAG